MAITEKPLSITFNASNEGIALDSVRYITAVTFWGTGLTPGQQLSLRDNATPGEGSLLIDYVVDATLDNADLWVGRVPQRVSALSIDNITIDGTWALTVFTWDERNR